MITGAVVGGAAALASSVYPGSGGGAGSPTFPSAGTPGQRQRL